MAWYTEDERGGGEIAVRRLKKIENRTESQIGNRQWTTEMTGSVQGNKSKNTRVLQLTLFND